MLITKLEAILFAVAKPVTVSQLQKQLNVSAEVLSEAIRSIKERYNIEGSGIQLIEHNGKLQLVSNPQVGEDVATFLKKEASGPLTRPSLETLAVIAYRGPVTKPEIEQVRGVNCSLILRNLLIRGLIDEVEDKQKLQPVYTVTHDFLRELGLHSLEELPEFDAFHTNEKIEQLMAEINSSQPSI